MKSNPPSQVKKKKSSSVGDGVVRVIEWRQLPIKKEKRDQTTILHFL
jgi:hypothetical protein